MALTAVLLSALMLVLGSAGAGAVGFGLSEPTGVCAEWMGSECAAWSGGVGALWTMPSFHILKRRLPLRYFKLSAAYNLLADYDPGTHRCEASTPYRLGGEDGHGYWAPGEGWKILSAELRVVHEAGLSPLVTITDGLALKARGANRDPPWPIPVHWTGRRYDLTLAGLDYRCGVSQLVARVAAEEKALHAPVAQWETLDEPDARKAYNGSLNGACTSGNSSCAGRYRALCAPAVGTRCGPLEAAWLYMELLHQVRVQHVGGKVAALAVTNPGPYAYSYLLELISTLRTRPAVISFHDYIDPTADGTSLAHSFATRLSREWGGRFELWITESGVYLSETVALPPSGGSSSAHGCEFGPANARGLRGLGRCVDGNARAQAAGAADFKFRLAQLGGNGAVRITELFWFQYQALPPTPTRPIQWDSGLLDAHGTPRQSYCVLAGVTGCTGNPYRNR